MFRKSAALLISTCLATTSLVSGCATQGLKDAAFAGLPAQALGSANATCEENVVNARKCLSAKQASYFSSAENYADENSAWGYGFTAIAVAGVAAAAFDSSIAALKAIGIFAGGVTAVNADRGPSNLAVLYTNATKALACMNEASAPLDGAASANLIDSVVGKGNDDLLLAQNFAAQNPSDAHITTLSASIDAYTSAVQVGVNASDIVKHPGTYIVSRVGDADNRVLAKLNVAQTGVSDQMTQIQGMMQKIAQDDATKKAQAIPAPTNPAGPGAAAATPAPKTALDLSSDLKTDTQALLNDLKPYTDAQANIPACLTNIPA
jgi:hypothetical protein